MSRKVFISSAATRDKALVLVGRIDPIAQSFWWPLLPTLDDWGRAEADVIEMKAGHFGGMPLYTEDVIENALQLFAAQGLIKLYEINGKRYLSVDPESWWKIQTHIHQSKRDADRSRIPAPPEDYTPPPPQPREESREVAELREPPRLPAELRGNGEGEGEGVREEKGKSRARGRRQPREENPVFVEIFEAGKWRAGTSRGNTIALMAATLARRRDKTAADLLAGTRSYFAHCQATGREIMQGETFFGRQEKWDLDNTDWSIPPPQQTGIIQHPSARAAPRETPNEAIDRGLREMQEIRRAMNG